MKMTLHSTGSGYKTEAEDGAMKSHPHIGAALMHMASEAEPEHDHMHIKTDSETGEHVTHHVHAGKSPQGPHNHADDGKLVAHVMRHHGTPGYAAMHAVEHESGGYRTHHVSATGRAGGPHDHENIEALKRHLVKFFNEESAEE